MSKVPQKKAQHVVPNSTGGWNVKKAGVLKPVDSFKTQKEAISAAKEISRRQKTVMYVHREDGSISAVHNYGSKRGGQ